MPRMQCQAVSGWDAWDKVRDAAKNTVPTRMPGCSTRVWQGQCVPAEKVSCSCSSTISSATKSWRSLKRPLYSRSPSRSCVANLGNTSARSAPIPNSPIPPNPTVPPWHFPTSSDPAVPLRPTPHALPHDLVPTVRCWVPISPCPHKVPPTPLPPCQVVTHTLSSHPVPSECPSPHTQSPHSPSDAFEIPTTPHSKLCQWGHAPTHPPSAHMTPITSSLVNGATITIYPTPHVTPTGAHTIPHLPSFPQAHMRPRVKWKRWRSPRKVRKERGGKLRVLMVQKGFS